LRISKKRRLRKFIRPLNCGLYFFATKNYKRKSLTFYVNYVIIIPEREKEIKKNVSSSYYGYFDDSQRFWNYPQLSAEFLKKRLDICLTLCYYNTRKRKNKKRRSKKK